VKRRIYSILCTLFLGTLILAGCSPSTGTDDPDQGPDPSPYTLFLTGKVLDKDGRGINGAIAHMVDVGLSDTTDADGNYTIADTSEQFLQALLKSAADPQDSLHILRDGQLITTLEIMDWIDTLPDVFIIQRDVYGNFLDNQESIGDIEAVLTGTDIPDSIPKVTELWYNSATHGYSGFIYFVYTAEVKDYTVYINVFNQDSMFIGRSISVDFTSNAGDINVPDFNPDNAKPVPEAGPDTTVVINGTMSLYPTAVDSFGTIIMYKWDFDGDGAYDDSSSTPDLMSYVYTHEDVYTVTLYVRDDDGNEGTDTRSITVANNAPEINNIRPDTSISVFDSIAMTAEAVDNDGIIEEYAWDFDGDGTFDYTSDTEINSGYKYDVASTYTAVLRLTDDDNKQSTFTVEITVLQDKPVPDAGPDTTVVINDTVALFTSASDGYGNIIMYKWDFDGDGVYEDSSTEAVFMSHVYTHEDVYDAVLYVRDDDGNDTTGIRTITVSNSAPVVNSIRADTTISVFDSIAITAEAEDVDGAIQEYAWDFDGDGTFDYTSDTEINSAYKYNTTGIYNAVLRLTDDDAKTSEDTVVITVIQDIPQITFISNDTVVDYGGTVTCSVYAVQNYGTLKVEIDTSNGGNFIILPDNDTSAAYSFQTGTNSDWDSVKVRITDDDSNVVYGAFKVDIRPRILSIASTDSTVNTITVNYSQSQESDFVEYRIYRNTASEVDSSHELWATVTDKGTITYQSSDEGYDFTRYYYMVNQVDSEGLISTGSNVFNARIVNSPPTTPVITYPSIDGDSIWPDDTLRWAKCTDLNGHSVTYRVLVTDSAGIAINRELGIDLTDTTIQLTGFDSLSITWKVIAYDNQGDSSAWSNERIVTLKPLLVDMRDGNKYKYVRIGTQMWMAENLAYLPQVNDGWNGSEIDKYYYVYDYTPLGATEPEKVTNAKATSNYQTYGVLYNWTAAMDSAVSSSASPSGVQGVCPSGWHLPSDAEWNVLANFSGDSTVMGGKLKSASAWDGTDDYNFSALPSGSGDLAGPFNDLGNDAFYWAATEINASTAWSRSLETGQDEVFRYTYWAKSFSASVRCLEDEN
jgi:uncharacterized protein (TIGR02145 family)